MLRGYPIRLRANWSFLSCFSRMAVKVSNAHIRFHVLPAEPQWFFVLNMPRLSCFDG